MRSRQQSHYRGWLAVPEQCALRWGLPGTQSVEYGDGPQLYKLTKISPEAVVYPRYLPRAGETMIGAAAFPYVSIGLRR
jgi:hypothetical protein